MKKVFALRCLLAAFTLLLGWQNCAVTNAAEQDGKKLKVLFLCTGNSCRSQMAEGWAETLLNDKVEAYSAGIETHGLNPNAVRVMQEAGVDITKHQSKLVKDIKDVQFDYVIAVCPHADENRPVFPSATKVVFHPFDDPPKLAKQFDKEQDQLNVYRRVRDDIKAYIATLPEVLKAEKPKSVSKKSFRSRFLNRLRQAAR